MKLNQKSDECNCLNTSKKYDSETGCCESLLAKSIVTDMSPEKVKLMEKRNYLYDSEMIWSNNISIDSSFKDKTPYFRN